MLYPAEVLGPWQSGMAQGGRCRPRTAALGTYSLASVTYNPPSWLCGGITRSDNPTIIPLNVFEPTAALLPLVTRRFRVISHKTTLTNFILLIAFPTPHWFVVIIDTQWSKYVFKFSLYHIWNKIHRLCRRYCWVMTSSSLVLYAKYPPDSYPHNVYPLLLFTFHLADEYHTQFMSGYMYPVRMYYYMHPVRNNYCQVRIISQCCHSSHGRIFPTAYLEGKKERYLSHSYYASHTCQWVSSNET